MSRREERSGQQGFFISVFAWGWARERLAVGCCAAGWVVNVIAFLLLYNA